MATTTDLFTARTTNGSSTAHELNRSSASLFVWGTFDSCSVKLEISPNAGTDYVDGPTDWTFTAAGFVEIRVCPVEAGYVRATLSSAGAGTSINVRIID